MSASITRCGGRCTSTNASHASSRYDVDAGVSSSPSTSTTAVSAVQVASASRRPNQRSRVVTRTRTSQSARMYATWSLFSSGLTGTNAQPAAAAPNTATTNSMRLSR